MGSIYNIHSTEICNVNNSEWHGQIHAGGCWESTYVVAAQMITDTLVTQLSSIKYMTAISDFRISRVCTSIVICTNPKNKIKIFSCWDTIFARYICKNTVTNNSIFPLCWVMIQISVATNYRWTALSYIRHGTIIMLILSLANHHVVISNIYSDHGMVHEPSTCSMDRYKPDAAPVMAIRPFKDDTWTQWARNKTIVEEVVL